MTMGQCFNCGEETDCDDELGGRKIYVCASQKCRRALRDDNAANESEARERAEQDDFNRYR